VTAFKAGDGQVRRGGRNTGLGVEFDVYWLSPDEVERRLTDAGFATVFWGGRPAEGQEGSPQGYLLAQRSWRLTITSISRDECGGPVVSVVIP
jgi:hypothetical protein